MGSHMRAYYCKVKEPQGAVAVDLCYGYRVTELLGYHQWPGPGPGTTEYPGTFRLCMR